MKQLKQVEEFQIAFGMPVLKPSQDPKKARFLLRKKLVEEEVGELIEAWYNLRVDDSDENLMALLKEMADVEYVCLGMTLEMGWKKLEVNKAYNFMDMEAILAHMKATADHLMYLAHLNSIRSALFALVDEIGYTERWEELFDAVHESNMSKLGDDGKPVYREDGKVTKGPNYKKPDLSFLLKMPIQ